MTSSFVYPIVAAIAILVLAGSAAAQQPSDQPTVLKATHGNWQVHCTEASASETCIMVQSVTATKETKEKTRVLTALVARPPEGEPVMRLTVPLGVLLPSGLTLLVDNEEVGKIGFLTCLADGCITQIKLDDKLLERLKRGQEAVVALQDSRGASATLPLSLNGFTAAFESL